MKRVPLSRIALAAVVLGGIGVFVFRGKAADVSPVLQVSYDPGFADRTRWHQIEVFADGHAELHRYPLGSKERELVILFPRDEAAVAEGCEALANGPGEAGGICVDLPYASIVARKRGQSVVREVAFMVPGSSMPFDWVERGMNDDFPRVGELFELTPIQLEALKELRQVLREYSF
jgi:hypothetical protein